MKVNVGKFKAHLSQYLRELDDQNEPLEICVHDKTVAYLTSTNKMHERPDGLDFNTLRSTGLELLPAQSAQTIPLDKPVVAGDNHTHIETVSSMRGSKDW